MGHMFKLVWNARTVQDHGGTDGRLEHAGLTEMTRMKVLLLAALAVLISTAAQACTPSESDFQSLVASPSHLTPSEFSALTPAYQNAVCLTRAFIKQVDDQKGVLTHVKAYSARYLTPKEKLRLGKAAPDRTAKTLPAPRRDDKAVGYSRR